VIVILRRSPCRRRRFGAPPRPTPPRPPTTPLRRPLAGALANDRAAPRQARPDRHEVDQIEVRRKEPRGCVWGLFEVAFRWA
jgi:hypothetical protein